jgi:hypothetical protein
LPGILWTQLLSCPVGVFGPNQIVTEPSAFAFMTGWLLSNARQLLVGLQQRPASDLRPSSSG